MLTLLLVVVGVTAYRIWPRAGFTMTAAGDARDVQVAVAVDTTGAVRSSNTGDALSKIASCQARVRAADRVIAAARVGAGHWAEHVSAQYDADAGRITVDQLNAIFTRTRQLAPDDLTEYNDAVAAYNRIAGPCTGIDAAGSLRRTATACSARDDAQRPVLAAADLVMAEWSGHAASMSRSRHEHVSDAEAVWIAQYHAAPVAIDGWRAAVTAYHAPRC